MSASRPDSVTERDVLESWQLPTPRTDKLRRLVFEFGEPNPAALEAFNLCAILERELCEAKKALVYQIAIAAKQ
jgi:hypothetical protein